jgi:hypothetical protein
MLLVSIAIRGRSNATLTKEASHAQIVSPLGDPIAEFTKRRNGHFIDLWITRSLFGPKSRRIPHKMLLISWQ